jgi:alkanesulfonate monooxygenase SsuD/methylene tetrahydromethanopterin reductase-like flavin-dependent oxidoreductase (luciferase family)
MLAKKAATIDEISNGRLILGLGAGWNEVEYRAYGFPYDRRISRFEEAFTIIRTLLRDGRIDFEGKFYHARDCELVPRGPRPSGPPLLVGSMGERMLKITLPHVQAWNAWYDWFANSTEELVPILAMVDDASRAAGRDPAAIERTAALHVRLAGAIGRPVSDRTARPFRPIEGPPDVIAEQLLAFARIGVHHVQLVLDPITTSSIETMGRVLELLPAAP